MIAAASLADARTSNSPDYLLVDRAALLCGPDLFAHLAVWRASLQEQERDGGVHRCYLAAMRQVVLTEALAGHLDFVDAVAAAVAISEVQALQAHELAKEMLTQLGASSLAGAPVARVLAAAYALTEPAAATAQARMDLQALLREDDPSVRVAAQCLLADCYLREPQPMTESAAYKIYLAAADHKCAAAAFAHYRLGCWYAAQRHSEALPAAAGHFEAGAALGCRLCLAALGALHDGAGSDDFGQELLELAEICTSWLATGRAPARRGTVRMPFIDSVRGFLRGQMAA